MTPASQGGIVWLTGLSGAGKSTLARALADTLHPHRPVEVLDGDELRRTLSRDLGFTRADRDTQVARVGFVARLLARHGVLAIVALISPYAAARASEAAAARAAGLPFAEVFVDAPLTILEARDDKGLYARARRGELAAFTGVSDPYEAPTDPALVIPTHREPADASLARLVALVAAPPFGAAT